MTRQHLIKSILYAITANTLFPFTLLMGQYNDPSYYSDYTYNQDQPTYYDNDSNHTQSYYRHLDETQGNKKNSMGNWDYHNKWHYHRDAYLSGQTQAEYYQKHHRDQPRIGFDADNESQNTRSSQRNYR